MTKVAFYDENGTHFATFDMPEIPHKSDVVEIGFPTQQTVKMFIVERTFHKMIQLPAYETKYLDGHPVQCKVDPPWRWEFRVHGTLHDPEEFIPYEERKCICAPNQDAVKCPKHGQQDANRELCPKCGTHVLGYCAQGEYCTSEDCKYVA
jgi:hypothetical protein